MPDQIDSERLSEVSRRTLIGGGIAAAASLAAVVPAASAESGPPAIGELLSPAALEPPIEGLVYLPLDAFAFDTATVAATPYRLYQEITGMQPSVAANFIYASLPIPIGSIVRQINVAYQNQPIVSIARRAFAAPPDFVDVTPLTTLAAGGGVKTQTLSVNAELTHGATYAVKVFCSAGDSVLGMTIGYVPPAQAFVPYTGPTPRVFDSRSGARFAIGEERVIDLSSRLIASARAAVINLTATETAGPGFLSAYRDGIAFPGSSSVNYNGAGQSVANGVVVAMTAGRIKVRCGDAASHVIVDVIGSLL